MKKILIIGSAGAGKSTLATALGIRLNLPVIHLDREFWRPGWQVSPKQEWNAKVQDLCRREKWIMDGNFDSSLNLRLPTADTVIFLDFPRWLCLFRVFKRWLRYRGTHRPDMTPGCNEQLEKGFLLWIWNFPRDTVPDIEAALATHAQDKRVIRLKTPWALKLFLSEIEKRP